MPTYSNYDSSYEKKEESKLITNVFVFLIIFYAILRIIRNFKQSNFINLDDYKARFLEFDYSRISDFSGKSNSNFPIVLQLIMIGILFVLLIIFIRIVFLKFYLVHNKDALIFIRPWLLTFKTCIYYQIQNKGEFGRRLLTFLQNHPQLSWQYFIKMNSQGSTITIMLGGERKILPRRATQLRHYLLGILLSLNIKGKFVTPVIISKKYKVFGITGNHNIPSLHSIASKLENYPPKDIILSSQIQFTQKEGEMELFDVTMKVGISKANKVQIPIIQAFIKSLDQGVVLSKVRSQLSMSNEVLRLLKLPQLANFEQNKEYKFSAPSSEFNPQLIFGDILLDKEKITRFGINSSDLAQGGIICGAIGTGKTTLRLHLMKTLLDQNIRIIDFDLKGDAPRYLSLGSQGLIIQPNKNFNVNPFTCPAGYSIKEYSDTLLRVFLDTIPDNESLTPPQKHLLAKATQLTVTTQGNASDFFHNILLLSNNEKLIIDNHQENTGQSLLVKFDWMQSILGDIFWREKNSLTEGDYNNYNIFFDFSILVHTVPHKLIRFLMDVIMTRIMASMRHEGEYLDSKVPKLVIFIDEAQILMPRNSRNSKTGEFSRIEEAVVTLRYKGVSVIAAGISAELMSRVLLDTGFVAQFRSESTELLRGLGLFSLEETSIIPRLDRFTCITRTNSSGNRSIHVALDKFSEKQCNSDDFHLRVKLQHLPVISLLPSFTLDFETYWKAKIASVLIGKIRLGGFTKQYLEEKAKEFIAQELFSGDKLIHDKSIDNVIGQIYRKFQLMIKNRQSIRMIEKYPELFLVLVIQELFLHYVIKLREQPKIVHFERNYRLFISLAISYLDREMSDIWYTEIPVI